MTAITSQRQRDSKETFSLKDNMVAKVTTWQQICLPVKDKVMAETSSFKNKVMAETSSLKNTYN